MLFMTFQPVYSEKELEMGRHLRSKDRHAAAGYDIPVWCCGGSGLADMFLSAYFCAPRFPDDAVFFETDDFVRVDKAAWYGYVRDGKELDAAVLDPDLPDHMCEFITDFSEMASHYVLRVPLLYLEDMVRSHSGKMPLICAREMPSMPQDAWVNAMILTERHFDLMAGFRIAVESGDPVYKDKVHKARSAFLFGMFPLICSWLTGTYADGIEYAAWPWRGRIDGTIYPEFMDWQTGPCGRDGLARIMDAARRCVETDPVVLRALAASDGMPALNAACPCGSGKKFKLCHGKRYR